MDDKERLNDPEVTQRTAMAGYAAGLWTALPGIIESYDAGAQTCSVQPAIRGVVTGSNGTTSPVDMPLLVDVPVVFQRGGGATLTFPIAPGDECVVVFSSRCIDGWWQGGGVQSQLEMRMHDLSDGFAFVGPFSQPERLTGVSPDSVQIRKNDGTAHIELNVASGAVSILAPGGFNVVAPTWSMTTIDGGTLEGAISGITRFMGEVWANGKRIDDTHTHIGVEAGDDTSGTVT